MSLWSHSKPLEQLGPFPQRFEAPGGLSSLIMEPHLHGGLAGRNKRHKSRSHWFSH